MADGSTNTNNKCDICNTAKSKSEWSYNEGTVFLYDSIMIFLNSRLKERLFNYSYYGLIEYHCSFLTSIYLTENQNLNIVSLKCLVYISNEMILPVYQRICGNVK